MPGNKGKVEYDGGTVVAVVERDKNGNPTSHVERDAEGHCWHCVDGADPVLIRSNEEYDAIVAG